MSDHRYIDIHAHVLPSLDDGPSQLDESLDMARAAAGSGIATLAATPHLHPDFPDVHVGELAERCQALRTAMEEAGIDLEIIAGAEVSFNWAAEATDEELVLASYGQLGTDLLLETPFTQVVPIEPVLDLLEGKGYRVTLAHPERSPHFQRDESALRAIADRGVLLQLNAESVIGPTARSGPRRLARKLLVEGRAHVIASDGHRATDRRPVTRLAEGVEAAAGLVGPERAQWMAGAAPRAIIRGEEVPPAPPLQPPAKRRRRFGIW